MTTRLEELALRVLLPSFRGPSLPGGWADLLGEGLGGVCLFGSNLTGRVEDVAGLVAAVRGARADALVGIDEEGGDVTRLHVADGSPVLGAAALGAVDDLSLTEAAGGVVGAELAAVGIDLDLGPVADVNSNAANPVIGTRSFGSSAGVVGRHVAAWLTGLQAQGVAACVKHFPGHGDTAQDSHLALPVVEAERSVLDGRELLPFLAAVEAGAAAVMTSHIVVPAIDPTLPATFSRPVLSVLRDDLGFSGAIVSDALDMAGASAERGIPEAAVLALAAGCDLLCIGPDKDASLVREVQAAVVAAVREGRLPEARLVEAAARVGAVRRFRGSALERLAPQPPDASIFTDAARQAFLVEGELGDLRGARVVSIGTPANIAVGEGPWGLEPDLLLAPGEPLPEGPLVVQVRDAHRYPDVTDTLAGLRAPSVVVEWGWPGPRTGWRESGVARICTRGFSRPAAAAVVRLLGEAGWTR
ncbi:beta-N-acetylhexosaminidase [Nocardioides thalensis]|uniref:Beta-N-acetylhexosaminidase n=1 Tax=Nocardioides thalensis TaxID=1914755 RepID=A0A853C1E2_9ACTN|nr:glycoside hydrolase family 3 protein [Nocardioides thalensis]NYJ00173.1 beta-N-acetylhexosaminidase [Nocardioides thalensis]